MILNIKIIIISLILKKLVLTRALNHQLGVIGYHFINFKINK